MLCSIEKVTTEHWRPWIARNRRVYNK